MVPTDWNPEKYAHFSELRLRPALDLLTRVGMIGAGDIVDLGCGAGVVGPMLRTRFPDRQLIGVDSSPAMLAKALDTGAYDTLIEVDVGSWQPRNPLALIYSNALLHWLPDHHKLIPALLEKLAPGGVLAVQVPRQNAAPSHQNWLRLAAKMFPDAGLSEPKPDVLEPVAYGELLADGDIWETTYFQTLPASDQGHPVRRFTETTFARPVLNALSADQRAALIAAYDDTIERHYPRRADGSVLFPFRRLFFVARG